MANLYNKVIPFSRKKRYLAYLILMLILVFWIFMGTVQRKKKIVHGPNGVLDNQNYYHHPQGMKAPSISTGRAIWTVLFLNITIALIITTSGKAK